VLQSYNNRQLCIEILAKECQNYQNSLYSATAVSSPTVYRSAEDIWQQHWNYDSAESLSSISSGHSGGTPSFAQMSHDVANSAMRSSQSYPYIPPTDSSGRVHDPTPRSSLPISSLEIVPPRAVVVNSPATAAVMQHGPFSFRSPDAQLNHHSPTLPHSAGVLVVEPFSQHPHHVPRQHRSSEGAQNQCFLGGSPTAVNATKGGAKLKTVTSGVTYRVNASSANAGEQSKPTYLTATHVNLLTPDEGKLGTTERLQPNRLSDSMLPSASSGRLPGGALSAVYLNPQQSWLGSPQTPTTFVSSLSSSCDCLLPSVTDVSQSSSSSTHLPASTVSSSPNSSSHIAPGSESIATDPQYANGMKYATVLLHCVLASSCHLIYICIKLFSSKLNTSLLHIPCS